MKDEQSGKKRVTAKSERQRYIYDAVKMEREKKVAQGKKLSPARKAQVIKRARHFLNFLDAWVKYDKAKKAAKAARDAKYQRTA